MKNRKSQERSLYLQNRSNRPKKEKVTDGNGTDLDDSEMPAQQHRTPPKDSEARQDAHQLLLGHNIDPGQLSESQFDSFQCQNLEVQLASIEMYESNLSLHTPILDSPVDEESGGTLIHLAARRAEEQLAGKVPGSTP